MMSFLFDIIGTSLEMCMLYTLQNTSTKKTGKPVVTLLYLLLAAVIVFMTTINTGFLVKVLVILLCTTVIMKSCYQVSLGRIAFCYILYLLSISMGEILGFGIVRLVFGGSVNSLMQNPYKLLIVILTSKLFTLIFIMYIKHFISRAHAYLGKGLLLTITPLLSCFLILFMESFRIFSYEEISPRESLFATLSTVFIIVSVFCIIILIEKYLQTKEIEHTTNLDIHQINNSYHFLSRKTESQEQVMELYHDLKNHLLILQSKHGESGYINGLMHKIHDYELFTDTGNAILNTVLYEKNKQSQMHHIEFYSRINMNQILTVKDYDICSIFGNALDNAIEACLEIEREEDRKISVCADRVHNFFIIKVENSKKDESLLSDDVMKSSKADQSLHGHGLKSINRAVHKYNGEVGIKYSRTSFTLTIAIPLNVTA